MEENQKEEGLSGLKKTLIGTLTTVIGGAGIWVSTHLFGGASEDKEEAKTEQVAAPAAAPVVINLSNSNTNQQKQQSNNTNNQKGAVAPASQPAPAPAPKKTEEDPW
jgi:hypothetical protein